MKAIITIAALTLGSLIGFSQGTLHFLNVDQNGLMTLRVTNYAGVGYPPGGTAIMKAGLYWAAGAGASEASLQLLSPTSGGVTTTWLTSGIFSGGNATFPLPGGSTITFQVRVWNAAYSSFEAAMIAAQPTDEFGKSSVMTIALGNAPGIPVNTVAANYYDATGVSRFGVFPLGFNELPPTIPEPSFLILSVLGFGLLGLKGIRLSLGKEIKCNAVPRRDREQMNYDKA